MNYRYLTSPEKMARLHSTKNESRALKMRLKRLEAKLAEMVEKNGVTIDDALSEDMCKMVAENDRRVQEEFKEDTFQYIFWKQQREAMGKEGVKRNGIHWHPLIIKWCLYLCHQSSKAYNTARFRMYCVAITAYFTRLLICSQDKCWFFF